MTAPAAVGVRDLLRIPDFRRLYAAQAVSDVGDGMTYLALFLLVLALTGSAAMVAMVSILVALPPVTVGLFAGAWADRADRRRIMLASDGLRAVLVAALVPAALASSLPAILALAFAQSVVGTFFTPARGALVPKSIPERGFLAASSLGQSTRMVATVLGSMATGLLAAGTGVVWPVFLADAATFLVSVAIVLRVTPSLGRPDAAAAARIGAQGMGRAVLEGLGVVRRSGPLLAALCGLTVTLLGIGAVNVLFVPFLVQELGGSPALAGVMDAAQTASMVLAGGILAANAARVRPGPLLAGSLAGAGVCVMLLGAAPNPAVLLVLTFAVGWFVMPVQAMTMTIMASETDNANRGRVAGAFNASMQTASIVSMAAAGILAGVVGMRPVFYAGGAMGIVAAVVALALFRWSPRATAADSETGGAASLPHPPVETAPG